MNPMLAHRMHVGGLGALIVLSLMSVYFQFGVPYPSEFAAHRWFGVVYGIVIAGLLGIRLRQVILQAIVVDPKSGAERFAASTGQILIALAFIGVLAGLILNFVGGTSRISLVSKVTMAAFWVGLACIELVIANGRCAVLPSGERPSGTARFFVGLFLLFAGFVLGIMAVFGFFLFSLGH